MRTAVFALPMVRPHKGHVCTRREPISFVDAFLPSSAMARFMSSSTTQPATSFSCSCNHSVISLARRSAKHRTASGPVSTSRLVVVMAAQGRIRFFSRMSVRDAQRASLRRHSEERTMAAPVRSRMCRNALMAEGKKSEVSTRTASVSTRMSKPPARAGRSTPSTSRKTTLVRSSGGSVVLLAFSRTTASCILASVVFFSDSRSGWGMSL
mmetsp:Transcript_33173/g.72340  ORF Transcript_33173/g.72340 Transcript_33173/m.72340 type:complete len:210 (+) Transcript_33173:509-1138(+)